MPPCGIAADRVPAVKAGCVADTPKGFSLDSRGPLLGFSRHGAQARYLQGVNMHAPASEALAAVQMFQVIFEVRGGFLLKKLPHEVLGGFSQGNLIFLVDLEQCELLAEELRLG